MRGYERGNAGLRRAERGGGVRGGNAGLRRVEHGGGVRGGNAGLRRVEVAYGDGYANLPHYLTVTSLYP